MRDNIGDDAPPVNNSTFRTIASMTRDPSPLEYAVLGLLADGAQSGYEVRRVFATTAMRMYSDSPGSIYPALQRLARRRLIRAVMMLLT